VRIQHRARPVCQSKGGIEIVSAHQRLAGQNRQVLSYAVAEDRPEGTHAESAAVTGANHGLGIPLIRQAHARREQLIVVLNVPTAAVVAHTVRVDFTGPEVEVAAVPRRIHGLRFVYFPAQPIVKG